ncbi:cytochrome P450 [Streptomyces sp. NPDC087263]|uniref:cytochrome P450 n=1 Tax=Streptomyces sp. NPDC087263 TaxID=3365773 RepID=UPI003829B2CF
MTETPTAPPAYSTTRAPGCPFDPPPERARLLEEAPVSRVSLWNGQIAWLVTRHADQVTLLRDERISSDITQSGFPFSSAGAQAQIAESQTFISMDDPEHSEQRRRFTADFTVKRIESLRPRIGEIITELLDAMEKAGPPVDLVTAFALPLPSLVICELLGVPYEDHEFFQRTSAVLVNTRSTPQDAVAATRELLDYLGNLVAGKADRPTDDLLSRMATQYLRTGVSTREECAKQALLLLVAGHETTANMIALGTATLLQHPDQLAAVRDGSPARVAGAVEELLRYLTVVHLGRRRVALEDIWIDGQIIRAGDGVICAAEIGNRDPEIFEDPDRLDVDRPQARRHLAFGTGTHQCLGQNLARMELQLAYPALLRRFPGLRIDQPLDEVRFRTDMGVYGVHELPVAW